MSDLRHLAIIPDGNRRWAREQGFPSLEGHRRGYDNAKTIAIAALELGIEHFSLWAFSTENWKRSQEEVGYLMDLLLKALRQEIEFYQKHSVRLRVFGKKEDLSVELQKAIDEAQAKTSGGTRGQYNLFINYGGRAEIVDCVKGLLAREVKPEQIDEQMITSSLWTAELPEPDLIIRTSGEQRLSGFMSWAGVYSELMFEEIYWPAFTTKDLERCVKAFHERDRRFGA